MFRPLISIFVLALLPVVALAQQVEFRSVSSGVWSDTRNWQQENSGVWQSPERGVFPGESRHRDVNVTIDNGSVVVIGEGQEVHVNSLTVMNGRLEVNGMIVIGDFANDADANTDDQPDLRNEVSVPTAPAIGLQLLQNSPNPSFASTGGVTNLTFYIDADYPTVRLSLFDELGREIERVYDVAHPETGWHSLKISTTDLRSGSYHLVLQAGNNAQHRTMSVVR